MNHQIKIFEGLFSAAKPEFKHWNIFIFTIAFMKACGKTIKDVGVTKRLLMIF